MCEVCPHLERQVKDTAFVVRLRSADLERIERVHDEAEEALQAHRIAAHGVRS